MSVAAVVGGQLNLNANCYQTQSTGNINQGGSTLNELISVAIQWINGFASAAYNVDQLYAKQLTIASTTTTVHFQNASATDPFGNTIAMARMRLLIVQNTTVTPTFDVTVAQSASNGVPWLAVAANAPPICYAGATLMFLDPISVSTAGQVTAASLDGISFISASHTTVVNVVALGCSVP